MVKHSLAFASLRVESGNTTETTSQLVAGSWFEVDTHRGVVGKEENLQGPAAEKNVLDKTVEAAESWVFMPLSLALLN